MFLRECDNYVDGGVICNNPTDCGLTVIQNFYRKKKMKPPIALVVSIGSGIFPAEKIGNVDAQAFLYFGKQWLQVNKLMKRTQNLLTLLSQAVSEQQKNLSHPYATLSFRCDMMCDVLMCILGGAWKWAYDNYNFVPHRVYTNSQGYRRGVVVQGVLPLLYINMNYMKT